MSTGKPRSEPAPPEKPTKPVIPVSDPTETLDLTDEDMAKLREEAATWKDLVEKD